MSTRQRLSRFVRRPHDLLISFLVYVAVYLLSELLRPKPNFEDAKPAGLGDFDFPTATEDRVVPLIWGTIQLSGPNVVWYGDLKQKPIKETVKTGLFSSDDVVVGFKYLIGIQFGLCRGDSVDSCQLRRIWIGEEEVFSGSVTSEATDIVIDSPNLFGGIEQGTGGVTGTVRFFPGTETQAASTYLSPFQQEGGDTPAYRGTCHLVAEQVYVGTSANMKPWWFELRRIPTGLGASNSLVNSNDAGLAHVAYEAMTNDEWGLGLPAADIDVSNFQTQAATLFTEGNGFSFVLDGRRQVSDLTTMLEEQMGGRIFLNGSTGKWQIKLARADYVLASLPELTVANVREVKSFSRGAWDETSNHVTVKFDDRALDYKGTFALAQDMANQRIQSRTVTAAENYPGVKNAALANNLAWRTLRGLSTPLAKAVVLVDRSFWNTVPVSVVKWTWPELGISELPMRVMKVDLGTLQDDTIELTLVQDVFAFEEATYGDPFGTGWTPPDDNLPALDADEQVVIEAPRAFVIREPGFGGTPTDKIWAGFHETNNETTATIMERHHPTTPSGAFSMAGQIFSAFLVGELANAIEPGASPSTIEVTPTTDPQAEILEDLVAKTAAQVGQDLANVLYIGGEMIGFLTVAANASNVDFESCYRGFLDTAQRAHAAGTKVYVLSAGGNLTTTDFPPGDVVHIKLLTKSLTDELAEASATQVVVDLDNRIRRPYPPAEPAVNGTVYPPGTVSLDVAFGSGLDGEGLELHYARRDFRAPDELLAVSDDEASLPAGFPTDNSTEYQVLVRNDPDGANTLLFTIPWGTAQNDHEVSRTRILRYTNGTIPTRMRLQVETRHTFEAVVFEALQDVLCDFDTASADLTGLFNLTTLDDSEVSPGFTATDTGTYTFTIGTDLFTTGAVEARINAGAFVSVIASGGGTTGTLPGVTAGDTIEVRHTQTGGNTTETLLLVEDNSGDDIAYGVLVV